MIEIIYRLYYLKRRFKGGLPEKIASVKASILEHNLTEKFEQLNDKDFFYSVGIVFSRQSEPITMGDLSRLLGVPFSTTTRIVEWLVRNSYARRLSDPDDRRIVHVELTDTGKEIYLAFNDLLVNRVEEFMSNFSAEEREDLIHLLRKLVDILDRDYVYM